MTVAKSLCCAFLWLAALATGAVALAQDNEIRSVRITITKVDCSRLVRHIPSADVAYKPGEGVNGKKVAPADLPGSGAASVPSLLPDVLEIPLNIKPLSGSSFATHGLGDTQSSLGAVRYDIGKGTFTMDGQPIGDSEQAALAEACTRQGVR